MKLAEFIRKNRNVIYVMAGISLIGMLGHENDFSSTGFIFDVTTIVLGILCIIAQQLQIIHEEKESK